MFQHSLKTLIGMMLLLAGRLIVAPGPASAQDQPSKLPKEKQSKALSQPIEQKPSILDGAEPDDAELKANELAMQADLEIMNKLLESNEPLKVAHEEIKRLNYLLAEQEVRIAALMNEKSQCIKLCKKQQAQLDKFYKAQK